jgi:UDP-N-acetylglucosamine acyltransferase
MTIKIHPTAIIDPSAIIHESVEVGAYTIIGPNVEIGEGTTVGSHTCINGHTIIGKNNHIFQFASVGEAPQDKKYNNEPTRLVIGDNNTIREFCTLHRGTVSGGGVTKIGNNNWIMAYVHIAHDCIVGNNTIFSNNATLAGHVFVKDWAILAGHTVVHQFCIVGEHSMIAGNSGIAKDLPPYVMAFGHSAEPKGVNTEGLKRRNFTQEQIDNIKNAYKILYRSGLSYNEAKVCIVDLAETQPELQVFVDFFNQSVRGIIR